MSQSYVSPISVAIHKGQKYILKLILEEAESSYDLLNVDETSGDTIVHSACKHSSDILILESILIKLRTVITSKDEIKAFLAQVNKDGLKALDYCVFKNRHDMAVILQEFVESSQ